jgi:hypothetical protein
MIFTNKKFIIFLSIAICLAIILVVVVLLLFKNGKSLSTKESSSLGINLDDSTIKTIPSKSTFPSNWPLTKTPINSARTYHVSDNSLKWLNYLTLNNVEVFIGMYTKSEVDMLATSISSWTQNQRANIIAYSVYNEPKTTDIVASLIDTIGYLKSKLSIIPGALKPVTVCLQFTNLWINPTYPISSAKFTDKALQLFNHLDFICFNIYGSFFDESNTVKRYKGNLQNALTESLSWSDGSILNNQFKAVRTAMTKAGISSYKFWASEIGWQGAPDGISTSWNNLANEKKFYTNFLLTPKGDNILPDRLFWFSLRDSGTEYFGLYTSDFISKF